MVKSSADAYKFGLTEGQEQSLEWVVLETHRAVLYWLMDNDGQRSGIATGVYRGTDPPVRIRIQVGLEVEATDE